MFNRALWYLRRRGLQCALVASASVSLANAQAVSTVRSGSFEIGGFAGASYGIDQFRVMGGGNVTFAAKKWLLPYAEFSYFPGIGRTQQEIFPSTGLPYTLHYAVPLTDFHGGVHIRLPIRESPIVPYLAFGIGELHSSATTIVATYQPVPGAPTVSTPPLPLAAGTNLAINMGGGIRFYLSQRFGIRVEAKAYKPFGNMPGLVGNAPPEVFGKVEGGFFFQLR